ncbi:MAG: TonB family protein [Hyphomonadaceae bacterium]
MSKDHDHEDMHGATTIRASKGGGGGKLLLGVVAAAVLLGGGYYAYQNYAAPQDGAETAYNDSYATDPYDDPVRAGPMQLSEETSGDDQLASTASEPSAPPARRAPARSEPIPEATIGVTPANVTEEELATTQDDEGIVVVAPPRPIWARTPSERRLASYYPERALERGREGEARLACTVLEGGSLDCSKTSETPGGFGNAALRVARTLRHAPTRSDGSEAAGTPLNLRVVFRIDDSDRQRFASR